MCCLSGIVCFEIEVGLSGMHRECMIICWLNGQYFFLPEPDYYLMIGSPSTRTDPFPVQFRNKELINSLRINNCIAEFITTYSKIR